MAEIQVNFRMGDWLKELLDGYCDEHGFKQERLIEALVYYAVVHGATGRKGVKADDIFRLIQEVTARSQAEAKNERKPG